MYSKGRVKACSAQYFQYNAHCSNMMRDPEPSYVRITGEN